MDTIFRRINVSVSISQNRIAAVLSEMNRVNKICENTSYAHGAGIKSRVYTYVPVYINNYYKYLQY